MSERKISLGPTVAQQDAAMARLQKRAEATHSDLVREARDGIPDEIADRVLRSPEAEKPLLERLHAHADEQVAFANLPWKNYEGQYHARLAMVLRLAALEIDRLASALEAAQAAVLAEREACAKTGEDACDCDACAYLVASAIRARSNKGEE